MTRVIVNGVASAEHPSLVISREMAGFLGVLRDQGALEPDHLHHVSFTFSWHGDKFHVHGLEVR